MFRCHVVFEYFCANKLHQNVNTLAVFLFIPKSLLGRDREADYNFFLRFLLLLTRLFDQFGF